MQNIRLNKIICYFIAIILLLSGMCFGVQKTHSLLVDSFSQQHENISDVEKNTAGQPKCLPELLEERLDRSATEIFEEKESKSIFRNFRFLGFLWFLSQNQANHFATVLEYLYDLGAENAVVVDYIHYSDGKK